MDKPEIVVNGRFEVEQEMLTTMRQALLRMQAASRAEVGCQDYTFSLELDSPSVIRITERWDDLASLEAHFVTPHMADFGRFLAANPPQKSEVVFFEVNEIPRPGS